MQAIAVAVIAACGGAITAVVTHLLARRKIAEVHVLVNARARAQDEKIARLEKLLAQVEDTAP